ncbi:MAG: hypothetical protein QGH29_11480 [Kiritimatiellia bacterium]|jgi:hypothetical protein|nr:hypothetical protein [Kiritimatiellia bacterium]
MKLPDNKQERTKIFVMIGLGAALVVLGIVQGIINPLRNSRKAKFARLEECKTGVEKARREIRAAARSFDRRMDTLRTIRQVSEQQILHPVLGKYLFSHSHKEKSQEETIIFVTVGLAMPDSILRETGLPEDTELARRHLIATETKRRALLAEIDKLNEAARKEIEKDTSEEKSKLLKRR